MYKLASLFLCPNVVGQIMVDLMVKPPTEGAAAELYQRESCGIIESLSRRAHNLSRALNALPGISCQPVEGLFHASSFFFAKGALRKTLMQRMQTRDHHELDESMAAHCPIVHSSGLAGQFNFVASCVPLPL